MVKAVTFDCAETLLRVDWRPDAFAMACAERAGIDLPDEARGLYFSLYVGRMPEFMAANRTRDPKDGNAFYARLGGDWLERLGRDRALVAHLIQAADELAYGEDSILFEPFEDAAPALERAREMGLKVAIISNWDYTLARTLDSFDLSRHVEFALASLVEGVEKPDPRLFQIALDRLGVEAAETLHVGDNPVDDFEGAREAGLHAVLIDRSREPALPHRIASLSQLPEAIACLA